MSRYDASTHDWSKLPRDLYVIEVRPHDIGIDVTMCSVPMIMLPEVRYVRADLVAGNLEIVAPPECTCDDPECLSRHEPLTLRQAYDNCLERLRRVEGRS